MSHGEFPHAEIGALHFLGDFDLVRIFLVFAFDAEAMFHSESTFPPRRLDRFQITRNNLNKKEFDWR